MAKTPQPEPVRAWAAARLTELDREREALLHLFPGLGSGAVRGARRAQPAAAGAARRRSNMSAAARKAVSQRMKLYWAERRKAKGGQAKKAAKG
jgi:hypothetical protein